MLRHVPVDPAESHLGVQPGAEPVLLWQQIRLEDGPDDQHDLHLAVADGGNAERPPASIALGYPHTQEGLGLVLARVQLLPPPFQPPLQAPGLDPGKALAVHPRRPRIGAAATIGFLQDVLTTDLVPEAVEAESRFSLSFRLQRGLERLNRTSGVGRLVVNHRAVGSFPRLVQVRAPSLHRRYPASAVLRTHPPSAVAGADPRGLAVEMKMPLHLTSADFPCCALLMSRACCHHYPGGIVGCVSRSLRRRRRPSPLLWRVGSHINCFEACSVFTRVAARTVR